MVEKKEGEEERNEDYNHALEIISSMNHSHKHTHRIYTSNNYSLEISRWTALKSSGFASRPTVIMSVLIEYVLATVPMLLCTELSLSPGPLSTTAKTAG